MDSKNIDSKVKEIIEYIEKEGFNIFYAEPQDELERYIYFLWDRNKDWRDFFKVAKKEGVTTIVSSIKVLDEDLLEELEESLEEERQRYIELNDKEGMVKISEIFKDLPKRIGNIAYYSFEWVKDGVEYMLKDSADWYREVTDIIQQGYTWYKSSLEENYDKLSI